MDQPKDSAESQPASYRRVKLGTLDGLPRCLMHSNNRTYSNEKDESCSIF
jgi:hypothetical protein